MSVHTFLKAENGTLTLLVRVPMISLRDVEMPTRPDGSLDLAQVEVPLRHASEMWIGNLVTVAEDGVALGRPTLAGARVALPSDRSFSSFDAAMAGISGPPLAADTALRPQGALVDLAYTWPVRSDAARFSIDPAPFARLGESVDVSLRLSAPGKPERAFTLSPEAGLVTLDPSFGQAFLMFMQDGFLHIIEGIDHLLFLLALVLPFRKLRPLIVIVTAFTVGHSITLLSAAFGLAPDALWFPYLIETLIALSILFMALENIVGADLARRWWLAFAFGLVHGFGFSFLHSERLQFAGSHLLASLLAFNVGVELGQLLMLVVFVVLLTLLFRRVPERIAVVIASALVAHTAWHWMTERGANLAAFPWPTMDAVTLQAALWWMTAAVVLAAVLWLVSGFVRRWQGEAPRQPAE